MAEVNVTYPAPFARRILTGEVPRLAPVSAGVVAPTIARPGEPLRLKVALAGEHGYPASDFEGAVTVRGDFAKPGAVEVRFERGAPAVAVIDGVAIREPGLYRFAVELNGETFAGNPVCCTVEPRPGVFWGDPHIHTVLSNCHPDRCRSLPFAFSAARWFAGLDWATAADHVSNGRCELARWKEQVALSNAHDDPPAFVTLPGYEASLRGGCGGDNNVYMRRWPDLFVDEYEDGDTRTLCEKLAEKLPREAFFLVPHHTTRTGKHGEIPPEIYPGPDAMPVMEVHSKWGTSEYRGNPNPLYELHPGPSYAVDLLNAGLRMGFVGGTDTHATMPAGFGEEHLDRLPGMTAILADGLSRENVFGAIRSRNCYATSLERIYLDVRVAGQPVGQAVEWADASRPREVAVTAAGRSDIEAIDIVRNGETVHTERPGGWRGAFAFTDDGDPSALWLEPPPAGAFAYYYVRVTCRSGAQAWSSPVWLTRP